MSAGAVIIIMRVTTFNEQTIPNLDEGIKKAVEKLGEAEPKGFVLDLRITQEVYYL